MGKNFISLGIGIIIALLLTWNNVDISDEEIINRAKELGMEFIDEIKLETETQDDKAREEKRKVIVEIVPGSSAQEIADILTLKGFDGELFLDEIISQEIVSEIKFGIYEINIDTSIDEIIYLMTK